MKAILNVGIIKMIRNWYSEITEEQTSALAIIRQLEYNRPMGGYRPKF
jgi:hypothetical protein